MNEAKIRLEYELKQKSESTNKILSELQNQNETWMGDWNDKTAMNKKLFNDNTNLFQNWENKKMENENLLKQHNQNENIINTLSEDKSRCDKEIESWTFTSHQNQSNLKEWSLQLEELNMQSQKKTKWIHEKTVELERNQRDWNEETFKNKNWVSQIAAREKTLETSQKQLEMANKSIAQIENDYNELNNSNNKLRKDLNEVKATFDKERSIRSEAERNNNKLENILKEKNEQISKLNLMNDSLKMNLDQVGGNRSKLLSDSERYKNYIMVLTTQTQKWSEALEEVVEQDEKMYATVNRTEQLNMFVDENKRVLAETIGDVQDFRKASTGMRTSPMRMNNTLWNSQSNYKQNTNLNVSQGRNVKGTYELNSF